MMIYSLTKRWTLHLSGMVLLLVIAIGISVLPNKIPVLMAKLSVQALKDSVLNLKFPVPEVKFPVPKVIISVPNMTKTAVYLRTNTLTIPGFKALGQTTMQELYPLPIASSPYAGNVSPGLFKLVPLCTI